MKHLVAALMVVLALAAPAAPDTREGSLDGQAAIEIGPFRIAVLREEDKETLRVNDLVVGRARAVSLIYLARMRSATVVAFHENEMEGGCEAPPSFLVLYSNGSYIVDRSQPISKGAGRPNSEPPREIKGVYLIGSGQESTPEPGRPFRSAPVNATKAPFPNGLLTALPTPKALTNPLA